MKREELDVLLEELTHQDISTDRQLEIFKAIQDDKDSSIAQINDLTEKSNKLANDFQDLRSKRVNEFFHKGTEVDPQKVEEDTGDDSNPANVTIDEILEP